jgi:ubiquinone/menaquinone biosynthesis C-methylase UbiE
LVDYSGRMASVYDAGRSLSSEVLEQWMVTAARYIVGGTRPILDLGSGTGRFSRALADRFGVTVVGMEPARGMRDRAALRAGAGVVLAGGRAEELPFADRAFGAVWASQVIHHVSDRAALAGEVARVLAPGGPVLLRGALSGRGEAVSWARWFPAAAERALAVFPRLEEITAEFAACGLELVAVDVVQQVIASDLNDLLERTRLRADSILAMLPDAEFRSGLAAMAHEVGRRGAGDPITEALDLAVFSAPRRR